MSWVDCELGDVLTLKRGYDLPTRQRKDGPVPVVSSSGITGYHDEARVRSPAVVTGRYGTLGNVYYVDRDCWPLNTALYVVDFKETHPRFAAYFLRNALRDYQSDKAAVPGVDRNVLHRFDVRVPDSSTQKAIASILSAYDDLIENNRCRIQLLERAARLLYREWFVHLRFPGHEWMTITDGVPEGWGKAYLADICDTQYGFTASATDKPHGPQFLRGTDINKTSYINWTRVPYCSPENLAFAKYALIKDDIVVIRMADPGKVAIVETDVRAVFASYLVRLTRKLGIDIPALYLFFVLDADDYQGFVSGASSGTTRKSASAKLLVDYPIMVPDHKLMSAFIARAKPMRQQIQVLLRQNGSLTQARDLLLPRLLNGEIPV